jgi:uncharacterized protein YcbX
MSRKQVGELAHLWRFPVKSMLGEKLDEAAVTQRGLVGDRGYALIETASGKVVSAKNVKAYPDMFACRAAYVVAPTLGEPLPPVRVTFPDGTSITSDSSDAGTKLSEFLKRDVTLAPVAPDDFTIDEYHPDIEKDDLGPAIEAKLGSALFARVGVPSPVPVGAFFDAFPLSVLTTSTLERLNALRPESRFDERRFRMNVIVRTTDAGFVENDWVSKLLAIGDDVRLQITMPDPRCVMTTLAQGELPRDIEVLRTLTQHNRIPIAGLGKSPCAGVYAVIAAAGILRKGDAVSLLIDE